MDEFGEVYIEANKSKMCKCVKVEGKYFYKNLARDIYYHILFVLSKEAQTVE